MAKQAIEINALNEKLDKQENKLLLFEKENQSVYQNPLLPEDDQTNKFNEFVNTMCVVRSDVEESSTNMEGAYRIWNKIKPKKFTSFPFVLHSHTSVRHMPHISLQSVVGLVRVTLSSLLDSSVLGVLLMYL